jgi:hypothetical protein
MAFFMERQKGKDHGKSFISFWIATGRQSAPRNDDPSGNDTITTKWKTTTALLETATPHPALSRKGRGNGTTTAKWKIVACHCALAKRRA